MATTKLTLSIAPDVIAKARRVSMHRKTSVSAMFSNYIATLDETEKAFPELPPMTKRALELASGMPQLPDDWDYRTELADAMTEKYGVK